jgi:two-component system, OmpR family, copper resistance phosphate regulon response regulator CusR
MRLLLVEDDLKHVYFIRRGLEEEQFAVDVAANGEEALDLIGVASYDLIILDLMLPKCDGFEMLKCLRARKYLIPVLILTAKTSIEDKVKGFELGTDDYLTKPFAFAELVARIRSLLRRNGPSRSLTLEIGDLTLDPLTRTVRRGQQLIALTNKEFSILEYLMRHPNRVLTRTMIVEHVWDYAFSIESNVIDVYMTMLRKKVDPEKKLIQTVRGAGYLVQEASWL